MQPLPAAPGPGSNSHFAMACDIVDAGISPFELQREGVFPAAPSDSAGNTRPSLRSGGLIPVSTLGHDPGSEPRNGNAFSQNDNCWSPVEYLDHRHIHQERPSVCANLNTSRPTQEMRQCDGIRGQPGGSGVSSNLRPGFTLRTGWLEVLEVLAGRHA